MTIEVVQVRRDEESIHSYLDRVKAFRLLSLKTSPEAFGSTYAKEIAFTNDIWHDRLANPKATTFLALQSGVIVCSLTLVEIPVIPEKSHPAIEPWTLNVDGADLAQLHMRINGMFTLPAARGQGIAKTLILRSLEYGTEEAKKDGKPFVATIVVDSDNPAAKALYEKCGFKYLLHKPYHVDRIRDAVLMKYEPK